MSESRVAAVVFALLTIAVVAFIIVAAAQQTAPNNPADAPCLDKGGDVYWTTVNGHLVCRAPR